MTDRKYNIRKVAVLGSGVMGSQIAAHCVNAGLEVWLLDLKSDDPNRPDKRAEEAVEKLPGISPAPLGLKEYRSRIHTGNFEDNLDVTGKVDWVCEVIVERMDIKKEMMSRLETVVRQGTIISTNTSGLPVSEICSDCEEAFRSHFLGVHFFNPPRYMKLTEVIPGEDTDPSVVTFMNHFCEKILGKGIVLCNDTPNFTGNRLGVFSIASVMPWYLNGEFRAEEIDLLTGLLTGYSKTATFRTSDIVGLDVLKHVAENLYPAVPHDERRELFQLPEKFQAMVKDGHLGNKTGEGFYKKVRTEKGTDYHVWNPGQKQYEPRQNVSFESVEKAKKEFQTAEERLRFLVAQPDRAGRFLWEIQCDLLLYAANRIPEITGSVEAIDRAMQWGYNWELGPFQRWDAIGVRESVERMESEGRQVPDNVKQMLASGRENFYESGTVFSLTGGRPESVSPPAKGAFTVAILDRRDSKVWGNEHAALHDMGDGIALFSFRTKNRTLGFGLVDSLGEACETVREQFYGMVIGHDGEDFSFGANLKEVLEAAESNRMEEVQRGIRNFQEAAMSLRYQPFPVVGAVSGRTLGGGAEFMMHCDRVVAHYELYSGLVELGVGLIPAGGGTKELLRRTLEDADLTGKTDLLPLVRDTFKIIGLARVSESAPIARKLGFLRKDDRVVMNRDLLLSVAGQQARVLADEGYLPPTEPKIRLLGRTAYSALKLTIYIMKESGFISGYDEVLAGHVAHILTGGDLSEPQDVPESYILKLEREAIFELLEDKRTLQRMEHMLKTGKPLRN